MAAEGRSGYRVMAGLLAGPAAMAAVLALPAPEGLPAAAWPVVAVALLMVVWWLSEALPAPATALVPVIAFPLLGVMEMRAAAAPYAHPLIFLFLGGFLIAGAVERSGLHRRVALGILGRAGAAPARLAASFMLAAALLSMWLSNSATAILMLPIALSVIGLLDRGDRRFAAALLLGVAYAASIGGLATPIGTPPNALLLAFLAERHGVEIGFAGWMLFATPLAALLLAATWLLLTRLVFRLDNRPIPGAGELVARDLARLGPVGREERLTAAAVLAVALLWLCRPLLAKALPGLALSDAGVALLGGLALFLLPVDLRRGRFLMDWEHARRLPWGVLILFGGGLSLASAIQESGLAGWIGEALAGLAAWPALALLLLVTAAAVFLTEIASNTATASVFIPIAATLGTGLAGDPLLFALPVTLAASCAFMMPVATPPNAIVYASGEIAIAQMARAGLAVNLLAVLMIAAAARWLPGGP